MKVLLVEDDEYLLSGLLMALKRREYLVETARTGTEALAALATTDFDIVILDLDCPASMAWKFYPE